MRERERDNKWERDNECEREAHGEDMEKKDKQRGLLIKLFIDRPHVWGKLDEKYCS